MNRRVVITGFGAVSPLGLTASEIWEGLLDGRSGTGKITKFDASEYPTQVAAEVKNFDPTKYFDKKELRRIGLLHQYTLVAADEAVKDSKIFDGDYNPVRIGTIIGTTNGGVRTMLEQYENFTNKGYKSMSPFLLQMMFCDMVPSLVSIKYNLKGPNYVTVSACSSGANAIGESFRLIQRGDVDAMVTGGAEASILPFSISGFCRIKAMSTRNDEPEKASRPFDKDRDGFVLGEGATIIILEDLQYALKRGANIYAEIIGYGMSSDAHHWTMPDPKGEGASLSMEACLRDAGIKPTDVDYINAHGTATPLGDAAETKAIKSTFGEYAYKLTVNSTKSSVGHLLGGAGAIELFATAMAVKENRIHPTINLETPDPECDLDYSANKITEKEVNIAISNSLGFGGHNVTLAVKKFKE